MSDDDWRDLHPKLVDSRTGEEILITKENVLIGRHRSCDILIPVVEVSRRHCRIYKDDGVYYVEDLRTVNGTYVNERSIYQPQLLQNGFHLKIAKCSKWPAGCRNYIFRIPKDAQSARADAEEASELADVRRDLLDELAGEGDEVAAAAEADKSSRTPLRHLKFSVGRKREKPHRSPLVKYGEEEVWFLALSDIPVDEIMTMTFDFPKWKKGIEMPIKIVRVGRLKEREVYQVEAEVLEVPPEVRSRFNQMVEVGPLIKYFA